MSASGLPLVELDLDGTRLDGTALTALTELRVQQRLSLPALCELTWEGLGSDALPLVRGRMGAPVRIRIGEAPVLFEGDVTACERVYEPGGTFGLRLRCYDRLHRLRKRQPVRAHVGVSPGSLARELAAEGNLRVEAADDGPVQPWLVQWRESNLELLSRLAARSGLYLAVREDALLLLGLDGQGEPVQLNISQLDACSVEVNAELACREVVAFGWSTHDLEPKTASVSRARSDAAPDGGAPPSVFGGLDGRTQADRLAANQAQLEAMAQGERDRRAAAEVVLRGTAPGDSRLMPGTRVRLSGVEPEPGGTFVLTAAVHALSSETGWTTQFDTSPPPPPKEPGSIGFTLGRVSRIDPATGRVRVALLSFGDVESDWLNVVSPGAGADKGMAALPDVDDRVLVLFSHEDPNDAFVAGGLYMPGALRDSGMEESGVSRYFLRTRAGQVLGFDDARSAIRLESADGSSIEVSNEFVRLHATRPLILEAPGQPITIVGASVDFRRG